MDTTIFIADDFGMSVELGSVVIILFFRDLVPVKSEIPLILRVLHGSKEAPFSVDPFKRVCSRILES